ncbi:MAG: M3 family oligoendopeptidase [Anaerolineaceae bacterium]|jgi:oligoendopeptidase F|nr:M3 family oligoendopeptidase [Anaerolineaceae bacterium]
MTTKKEYPQTTWSKADLFPAPDSPELEETFATLENLTTDFEKRREQLSESIDSTTFMAILKELETLTYTSHKLYAFVELWFSEDTQNQSALSLLARIEQFMAGLSNRTMFFSLWWKALPEEAAKPLMAASGELAYWLEAIRHFKDYTLSEAEEKIINIKDVTGASALTTLYASITNRYTFKVTIDGEEKELTRGELMVYARHHDPELRAQAYQELYRVYGEDSPILGQIYQNLVRDWRNEQIDLRGYAAAITPRNMANDLPDDVIDTLLEVCRKNASLFQRFFRLKAQWLGVDKLRRYDVYAPVAESDKQYSYQQAHDMVMECFNEFDPTFAELAERVFADSHLDAEVRKGKRGGAFCLTAVPDLTPWVLLNYQGKADDVSTMAHELGHAIHSMLASDLSVFTAHACLPLAETASTFGEMVLVDRLLGQETDEKVRQDMLFNQIDDNYATILRQAFFAMFERTAHEMIASGASVDELADAYMENLKEQFGDSVEIGDEFRWEWVSIPHIYNVPFYVYAYTFGQLLVLALYQQFKSEGESFKPRYIQLLATGGSKAPMDALDAAGINVREASFWQGGFDYLESLIEQLEALPIPEN